MAQQGSHQPVFEDFSQLKLLFSDPVQHDYEAIRPIVLFADNVATRSEQIGMDRSTVGDKAHRFVQHGMLGLVDQRAAHSGRRFHTFPDPVARYILFIKNLYSPIHHREIARSVERKFGYKTNHHTVKRYLDRHPIPVQLPLEWIEFHAFEDAYHARWTVVRMYYEGWHMRRWPVCRRRCSELCWSVTRMHEDPTLRLHHRAYPFTFYTVRSPSTGRTSTSVL